MAAERESGYGVDGLSDALARQLHGLVRSAFAAEGLEVTIRGQLAVDGSGRHFGLQRLLAECLDALDDTASWPALVNERVAGMVRSISTLSRLEAHGLEHAHSRLLPFLIDETTFADPAQAAHAPLVLPGFRLFVALDLPEGAHILSASGEADLGGSEPVRRRAMENLAELRIADSRTVGDDSGARFHLLTDESPFTAGLVAMTDLVVTALTGRPLPPEGALVAVPTRRTLVVHPLEDLGVFGASLNAMGTYAQAVHGESSDALSPSVYWWRPGQVVRVTSFENGEPTITIDEEFQAVLEGMEGRPSPALVESLLDSPELARQRLLEGGVVLDFDLTLRLAGALLARGDDRTALLAGKLAGRSKDGRVRAAGYLAEAMVAKAQRRERGALSLLKSAAKTADPDVQAEVARLRGAVLEQRGKEQEAEEQYRLAMGMRRPGAAGQAALALAGLLVRRGRDADAVAALAVARECGVPLLAARAAVELAAIGQRTGDLQAAVRYFRAAAESGVPEVAPMAEVRLGLAYIKAGKTLDAADAFRSAARSTDPDAVAHAQLHLGIMGVNLGRLEDGVELLRTAERSANATVRAHAAEALRKLRQES